MGYSAANDKHDRSQQMYSSKYAQEIAAKQENIYN